MSGPCFAGKYSLEREIGSGSSARVFLAHHTEQGRQMAVKILASLGHGQDLRRESRMIADFSHPHIIRVYEMGTADFAGKTVPYVVMEHIPDGDLMSLLESRKRLPGKQAARIRAGVAAALAYAHARNVVHEDIKPQNILMEDRRWARLTDFSVVRASDPDGFSGAQRYAAPECFEGEASPASDVYSLGVSLYQTVVGGLPFRGDRRAVIRQHATELPSPPRERSQITEELNVTILHCLEKSPCRRPTAAELERRLRSMGRHPAVRYASRSARLWARRHLSN